MSRPAMLGSLWITVLPALLALGFTRFALGSQFASPVDLAPPPFVLGPELVAPELSSDQIASASEVVDSRLFSPEQSATLLNSAMYGGHLIQPDAPMPISLDASVGEAFRGQVTDAEFKPFFGEPGFIPVGFGPVPVSSFVQ